MTNNLPGIPAASLGITSAYASATAPHATGHIRIAWRNRLVVFRLRPVCVASFLVFALLALAITSLLLGSYPTRIKDIMALISSGHDSPAHTQAILISLRIPRILLAALCGAMLGLAGSAMQSFTRNGLADPGLIGVREGSIFAVLITILFLPAVPLFLRPVIGMTGGLAIAGLAIIIARSVAHLRFVLVGIGLSWLLASAIAMLLVTQDSQTAQTALAWIAGSLSSASWDFFPVALFFTAISALALFATARSADIALLGEKAAIGLGSNLKLTAMIQLVAAAVLSATCVATVGGIGFIGLIAPHLARLSTGQSRQFSVLFNSAIWGALLLLCADTIGRVAFLPLQLPAGVVLAVIGVPVLLGLLWKQRHQL
ncbi:FecCD family ABC transporter permease [Thalassospira mesophila]|uniref:FecCD family ABC transporter permease n=1 Tax=Thalassospira mesophila TaxID=1293891 RepID=UPI000A1F78A9|nr:iron ABC transporter permease [Thalassospira mesophila]